MKRLSVITMGLLVVGLGMFGCAQQVSRQTEAGWVTLIDGTRGLENWNRIGDANWRAEDGAIVADKGKGAISSRRTPTRTFKSGPSSGRITPRTAAFSSAFPIPRRSPPRAPTR